jgi:hypothetical protein
VSAIESDGFAVVPDNARWVNADRTVLVSRYPDGTMEVATREEPGAIWGPPVVVTMEAAA